MTAAGCLREPDSPLSETSREAEVESHVKTGQDVTYRDELLNKMYKFMGVVDTTVQHLQIKGLFILRQFLRKFAVIDQKTIVAVIALLTSKCT